MKFSVKGSGKLILSDILPAITGRSIDAYLKWGATSLTPNEAGDAIQSLINMINTVADKGNCIMAACNGAKDWSQADSGGQRLLVALLQITQKRINLAVNGDQSTLHLNYGLLQPFGLLSKKTIQGWVFIQYGDDIDKATKISNVEITKYGVQFYK